MRPIQRLFTRWFWITLVVLLGSVRSAAAAELPAEFRTPAAAAARVVLDDEPGLSGRPILPAPAPVNRRVPVLEYHYSTYRASAGVMMTTTWFTDQLHWLADQGYTGLTSAQFADYVDGRWDPPAKSVLLTFDVGASHFDDFSTVVIPTLRATGLRAVFFVQASQTREICDSGLACWPILLTWRDEGLISIESHSYYHQDFATLTPEQIVFNLKRARQIIEAHTGEPVLGMCYPYDSVNPAGFAALRALGYHYAVAGPTRPDRSVHRGDATPFALPRYYPYSGLDTYPAMIGMHGQTFAEMLQAAVQDQP